jgi:hypothetical protein
MLPQHWEVYKSYGRREVQDFPISIGLSASRLDISETMTAQWQGQGDKDRRKGMNNGDLYHGGQWIGIGAISQDP